MPNLNTISHPTRTRVPYAALLVFSAAAFDAAMVSGNVSVSSSDRNVDAQYKNACPGRCSNEPYALCTRNERCGDGNTCVPNPRCNNPEPMLWAVAMPCDYTVSAYPGPTLTFTFSDSTVTETVRQVWGSPTIWSRNVLLAAGVLDSDPQSAQCVEVFQQDCPTDGCRPLPSDVTADLIFAVCVAYRTAGVCEEQVDPDFFIGTVGQRVGLGGLVTFVDDLTNDSLDYGSTFTLPPPTAVPTVSEWGIVMMPLLLLGGLTIRFARLGRRWEAGSNRS